MLLVFSFLKEEHVIS